MFKHIEVAAFEVCHRKMPPELAHELTGTGLVTCRPESAAGWFEVTAGSKVGVGVGPGWQLHVHSHLEVSELMFLLSYARDTNGWRAPLAAYGATDLFGAVAAGFLRCAERALRQGVLRGYRRIEERSPVLRGRLMVGRQLARGGLPTPLDVARDVYDEDVIENRFLVTAAQILLRMRTVPAALATSLRGLLRNLDAVSVLDTRPAPALPLRTRLNLHYWPALVLAEMIIRNTSVSSTAGSARSATFSFELHRVFEQFLETALRSELGAQGFNVRAQTSDHHLDVERAIGLRPDLIVGKEGAVTAIIDAKFKHKEWPKADAYQMLAYLLAFDVPRGFIVSAAGANTDHSISSAGRTISLRTVALNGEPDSVLRRVRALAAEITAMHS